MISAGADCEKIVQQITASRRARQGVLQCARLRDPGRAEGDAKAGATARAPDKRLKHAAELLAKFG